MDSLIKHRKFVEDLQEKLRKKEPINFSPNSSSHVMRKKTYSSFVNGLGIKKMKNVLELNIKEHFIIVEPGVTMEELVDHTINFGLIPPVVPEFKGITVGGAINGAALESSSHIYGQFNDICLSYEVLLADGNVLTASPEQNKELFYAFSGSFGTLGCLLSVKISLIPCKPWLKLTLKKFLKSSDALDFLEELHKSPPSFMEGIVYSDKTIVISGNFEENISNLPVYKFSKFYSPWFYSIVDQNTMDRNLHEIAVPLKDYLFRHDRGAFWMGGYGFHPLMLFRYLMHKTFQLFDWNQNYKWLQPQFCNPKNPGLLNRLFFGGLTNSGKLYKSLHNRSETWFSKYFVIQDFYLPKKNVKTFIEHIQKKYKIYPLWICPIQATTEEQLFSPHCLSNEYLLFDIGVYGIPIHIDAEEAVKDLEHLTTQLKGKKMFYCTSFLTKEDFWNIYKEQKKSYQELRKKYTAEVIPDITQKVLH